MTIPDGDGLQRIGTQFPVHLMRTYQIAAPRKTHWRPASCAEYECDEYLHGWRTIVPGDSEQAHYIRHDLTRRHTAHMTEDGLVCFTFEAGQRGFGHEHMLPNGRPERFIERGGDWRGCPNRDARELRPDDWVDSFANNMISVKEQYERG